MNHLHKLALAATMTGVTLFAGTAAHAQYLTGSLSLACQVEMDFGPASFLDTTATTLTNFTSGLGIGDYSSIPQLTQFSATSLVLDDPLAFHLSSAAWGSFTPATYLILTHTSSAYEALLFGSYTPGSAMPGKRTTTGVMRLSINQSGNSLSGAIRLSTQGLTLSVPEPGNIALLVGMGLSGAGFLIRRRRK